MWYSTSIKENVQSKLSLFGNITACYKSRQSFHLFWIKVNLLTAIKFTHMSYQGSILQLLTLIIWSVTSWAWHFLSQMQKHQKRFVLLCPAFRLCIWLYRHKISKRKFVRQSYKNMGNQGRLSYYCFFFPPQQMMENISAQQQKCWPGTSKSLGKKWPR